MKIWHGIQLRRTLALTWPALVLGLLLAGNCLSAGETNVSTVPVLHSGATSLATNVPDQRHHYAVILNGDDSARHTLNVRFARFALLLRHYPASNIFTLAPGFEPPTRRQFFQTLRSLAKVVTSNDTVVIYTTGHGNVDDTGCGYVDLGKHGGVSTRELVESLRALPNPDLIYVGDQCYSGNFLSALQGAGLRCVAATDADETHEASCGYFAPSFWQGATGFVVEPKVDAYAALRTVTNRIDSVKQAFDYAVAQNRREGRNECQKWLFYAAPGREHLPF